MKKAKSKSKQQAGPYTETVIKHFQSPHNYGKMENPDGVGKVGNVVCGDVMWLYIKVGKGPGNREIIQDVSFETFGCVAAIATSSVITDMAKGKTLEAAAKINKQEIVKKLGGLPPVKIHCSVLAADAVAEAVYDYLSRNGKKIPVSLVEKHGTIQSEKAEIEKRYKDWVNIEENIHKEKPSA